MTLAQFCLAALVLLPLLTSATTILLRHQHRRILGAGAAVAVSLLTVPVVLAVAGGTPAELALGGYEAPLGIHLRADGLSALFLMMSTVVGAVTTFHAAALPHSTGQQVVTAGPPTGPVPRLNPEGVGSDGHHHVTGHTQDPAKDPSAPSIWRRAHPGFWPLWLGCWSGLNAVFLSGDLFNTYVGLELVGITAVGLVALGGRSAWSAALRYLFVAVLGSLLFLIGVGLIASVTGTLDMLQAAEALEDQESARPAAVFALCLMSVGLAMKLALVPMHRWLVPAHSGAPGAVSPLLSALVIKAALFVLLRCWLWVIAPSLAGDPGSGAALSVLAWAFGGLSAAAILVGSVMALRQDRLKPLVAYSTVAQAGYWLLFLPILFGTGAEGLPGAAEHEAGSEPSTVAAAGAVSGAVALALGHGLAKAALFLAAGFLKDLYGTDEISALRGSGRHNPLLIMAIGLSAVGLIGLPISLGFTGKWQLATAAVAAGQWWIVVVVALGTLLTAAYLLRAVAPLLVESDGGGAVETPEWKFRHVPLLPQLAAFTLGTLTVLTGMLGVQISTLLEVGAPW